MATPSAARMLRELRAARGQSLRSAARDLGIDPSYLSRLERGEKTPSAEVQQRAASHYDISAEELALAEGRVPPDIIRILQEQPQLLERLRAEYGTSGRS